VRSALQMMAQELPPQRFEAVDISSGEYIDHITHTGSLPSAQEPQRSPLASCHL
jgi:hypothetical protein